jgi:hypothetical protein
VGGRVAAAVPGADIALVEVYETDTSRATWSPDQ